MEPYENKDFFSLLQVHTDFEIYEIVQCDSNCSNYTEPKENEGWKKWGIVHLGSFVHPFIQFLK